jgi:hypothetical protein
MTKVASGNKLINHFGVAVEANDKIVVIDRVNGVVRIDPNNGSLTVVSSGGDLAGPIGGALLAWQCGSSLSATECQRATCGGGGSRIRTHRYLHWDLATSLHPCGGAPSSTRDRHFAPLRGFLAGAGSGEDLSRGLRCQERPAPLLG